MKRYYVVHVKLIWGMVLLSFASLLWNGVQFFSQKDNLIEERKNQKEVSYEYKKIEFAHSKVKDSVDCYLCGNNKRSLMGMYRNSDELGIVSVNHWHVENLRTRNRDDAGQLINSSGSVNTITGTGEGGNFFYSSPMSNRGISNVKVNYGEDSILDGKVARKLFCQACLEKLERVTETYVPEDKSPKVRDLFLIDFKTMGKNLQEDAAPIKYLRLLLRYLEPEDKRSEWEKDVWKLENFGFEVRQNPIDVIRTIKFTGIIQETIREEVKRASYIRIKYLSVGSLQGEIRAVRRFSEFLAKRNPEIKSLGEVGRLNIEEYLTYINLERGQERNLKTEMANLKNMLQQVGKVIDKPKLGKLFIKQDMPKAPEVAFKIYSDEEIKRLNYYIVNMEEQVARALILHQMLGGRISDTLTLRTDCLYQENGHYIVRMYQVKTSYYEKPIPDDVAKLIQKSIEYTYERYGETEYVFVNESNPSLPFQYSMLKHRVYTLIHENDICKDNGERMGFATHLFRHCYGMKLVELHLDDAAIAHLLGHRGVNTVYRYRRASGKLLVKETEELRKTMDEILSEIIKEWDGYEQVFKNG